MGCGTLNLPLDLVSITRLDVWVWSILRYSLRNWNGEGKEHDLEKISHYAEMAWTMEKSGARSKTIGDERSK